MNNLMPMFDQFCDHFLSSNHGMSLRWPFRALRRMDSAAHWGSGWKSQEKGQRRPWSQNQGQPGKEESPKKSEGEEEDRVVREQGACCAQVPAGRRRRVRGQWAASRLFSIVFLFFFCCILFKLCLWFSSHSHPRNIHLEFKEFASRIIGNEDKCLELKTNRVVVEMHDMWTNCLTWLDLMFQNCVLGWVFHPKPL